MIIGMNRFQNWLGGFAAIADGITILLTTKCFGFRLSWIEFCHRRNYRKTIGD